MENEEWFSETHRILGTSINHRTNKMNVQIVFPKNRPPLKLSIFESNRQSAHILDKNSQQKLPDGRWMIVWENTNPVFTKTIY